MTKIEYENIISLIKREVVPALGCTEPIAVALAAAKAARTLEAEPEHITVLASGNIIKNAMGVGIPGTGEQGLFIASALGALGGDPDRGLEVLAGVSAESIERAREFVKNDRVTVDAKDALEMLYVEVVCTGGGSTARVILKNTHTGIAFIEKDGKTLFEKREKVFDQPDMTDDNSHVELSVARIMEFALEAPMDSIRFILDAMAMNRAIGEEGLKNKYGLQIGRKMAENVERGILSAGMTNDAIILTTAAVDARMDGSDMPAMSNSGSGNQGITAMLPVAVAAEKLGASEEQLARALILSNLITIYIKSFLGALSALCGVVVAATGASCGITYLLGGGFTEITYAINNMTGNITGMICDGAKPGCAFKVSTGVIAAFEAAFLAVDGITVSGKDGIVEDNIENTIRNLTEVGSIGMSETDKLIQRIMVCK